MSLISSVVDRDGPQKTGPRLPKRQDRASNTQTALPSLLDSDRRNKLGSQPTPVPKVARNTLVRLSVLLVDGGTGRSDSNASPKKIPALSTSYRVPHTKSKEVLASQEDVPDTQGKLYSHILLLTIVL
jgi:hypothetical protein